MKKNNDLFVVILAGGSGTRFWPLSRAAMPKQFINIVGKNSLFQEAILRVKSFVPPSNIIIVTNRAHQKIIKKQIVSFRIPKSNILYEPEGKNTAPAICWAAAKIADKDPEAVMAVFPADHFIPKTKVFLGHLKNAAVLARQKYLVTLGIVPTRAETGYGYLKTSTARIKGKRILEVKQFVEKPSLNKARKYVKQKRYLWNSGMFVCICDFILDVFQKHLPKVAKVFQPYRETKIKTLWPGLQAISIDYGILEKASHVAAVSAGNMGWTDVGSWQSLSEVVSKNSKANKLMGNVIDLESQGLFVQGGKRLIVAVGLKDVVIVDTDDALLICPKDKSQKVKDVVSILKKNKRKTLL